MPNPLVVLGGGSILGGAYSANQAKKGAKAQVEAGDRASALEQQSADKQLALQREIWEKQQADYKPYLEQGTYGINSLGALMRNQRPIDSNIMGLSQGQQSTQPSQQSSSGLTTPADNLKKFSGVDWYSQPNAAPLAFGLGGTNVFSGSPNTSQSPNTMIPNYDVWDSSPTMLDRTTPKPSQGQALYNDRQQSYVNNTGGGFLNNPFDSYLASKGLAGGKFDTNNPAYQFQLKQGQQALDRSAAARGMGASGAQMKAAQQYGQGMASQQYDKEYNRASGEFGDYYNRLAGLAQGGQQATTSLQNAGNQYATGASNTLGSLGGYLQNNLGQAANARASGYIGGANAINGGIQGLTDNAFRLAGLFSPFGGR